MELMAQDGTNLYVYGPTPLSYALPGTNLGYAATGRVTTRRRSSRAPAGPQPVLNRSGFQSCYPICYGAS
eukprot:3932466-Rhodomonas_salina.1